MIVFSIEPSAALFFLKGAADGRQPVTFLFPAFKQD